MNQTIKQMMVMLFSVLFLAIVAIMVLSSSATAQATDPDRIQDMLQSADDHLAEQKPHIHYTFSDERIPTQHTTPYFNDEPVVYDSDRYEIERLEDELETLRHEVVTSDGYNTDYSDRITNGIIALIIIAIIAFIMYGAFGNNDMPKPHPYIPDTPDTTDRIRLTMEEMNELDAYMDTDEYKQTSNKDMAVNFKVAQIVANRPKGDE